MREAVVWGGVFLLVLVGFFGGFFFPGVTAFTYT